MLALLPIYAFPFTLHLKIASEITLYPVTPGWGFRAAESPRDRAVSGDPSRHGCPCSFCTSAAKGSAPLRVGGEVTGCTPGF